MLDRFIQQIHTGNSVRVWHGQGEFGILIKVKGLAAKKSVYNKDVPDEKVRAVGDYR